MNKAMHLLNKLQELEFAALETRLFLDTHPYDTGAQQCLQKYQYQISMLMPQVERYFGPLTQHGYSKENPSRWIFEPWPWELHY